MNLPHYTPTRNPSVLRLRAFPNSIVTFSSTRTLNPLESPSEKKSIVPAEGHESIKKIVDLSSPSAIYNPPQQPRSNLLKYQFTSLWTRDKKPRCIYCIRHGEKAPPVMNGPLKRIGELYKKRAVARARSNKELLNGRNPTQNGSLT